MKIVIPGNPISQKRHRFRLTGKFAQVYDPQSKDKKEIQDMLHNELMLRADWNEETYEEIIKTLDSEEIEIRLYFHLPISEKLSPIQRNRRSWGFDKPNIKPDIDNLQKFILDCGNGILWKDDSIITKINANKSFGDEPRTEIEIRVVTNMVAKESQKILSCFHPEELREFADHARSLTLHDFDKLTSEDEYEWKYIAKELKDFAQLYAKTLSKIAKIEGEKDGSA